MRAIFPEWWFNEKLSQRQRNSLICVLAKLKLEGLSRWFEDLKHVGNNCELLFRARQGAEAFHRHLLRSGYGPWWFARASGDPWGVRSRFTGLQLHFRGKHSAEGALIDAHIDSYNPGDPETGEVTSALSELGDAIIHQRLDDAHRSIVDDPVAVWRRLSQQAQRKGLTVPWVP